MNKLHIFAAFASSFVVASAATASPVTMDWVTVGNAGNAADPTTGFGAVDYEYRIGTYEVTNAQYAAFLNAVDPMASNSLFLYSGAMAGNFGGIEVQAGNAAGSRFVAQAGRENNPVSLVSWFSVARMANWMTNGQPSGGGGTESGVYTFDGLNSISGITRDLNNPNQVFIPTEDEWYKAAYHDASAGTAGDYFLYANGSDSVPISDQPGDNRAGANYFNDDGIANGFNDGFAVSGSPSFSSSTNPFTDVGAYSDAASPYGAFDMNGNMFEWTEAPIGPTGLFRALRGGSWDSTEFFLQSSNRLIFEEFFLSNDFGFRLASPIPAPGSVALLVASAPLLARRRRP